jgi:hypothetical protein
MRTVLFGPALLSVIAPVLLAAPASAAPPPRPVWVAGSLGGGGEPGFTDGAAFGALAVGLRLLPVVPEFGFREGIAGGSAIRREQGGIWFGVRFMPPAPQPFAPSFRFAFSHRHDAPIDVFLANPGKVLFGVSPGIVHRTGFETGAGLDVLLDRNGILGLFTQVTAVVMLDGQGWPLAVLGEVGLALHVGKPKEAR